MKIIDLCEDFLAKFWCSIFKHSFWKRNSEKILCFVIKLVE